MRSNDTEGLVLVVDDQPRNLGVLKTALTRDGYEVEVASDGSTALRWLSERRPDLILLDVMMPDMNGFELCGRIKEDSNLQDIPVIFISGDDHQGSIRKGFKVGGVDYVTKPFNKEELLARVRTHVQLRRAHLRHSAQLIERNQVLKLIANEWHRPLQRIVLSTAKLTALCKELDKETASMFAEEVISAERMLASIEAFLQMRGVDGVDDEGGMLEEGFTSDDLNRMIGRWYVTAKRKPLDIVMRDTARGAELGEVFFMARQMVDPVLDNAIQYSPVNGKVLVNITREANSVVMQVTDSGPGFPQNYLDQSFQPWVSLHGQTTLRGGDRHSGKNGKLGIGLAAAKRAAERIGAGLEIGNSAEGGAVVKMTFPIVKKARPLELRFHAPTENHEPFLA